MQVYTSGTGIVERATYVRIAVIDRDKCIVDDPRYDFAIAQVQAGPSMCSICCELARVMKVWLKIA